MQVSQIISHDVQMIPPDATVKEAAQCMRQADVGALPVCDAGRLVGMITDRDIAMRAVAEGSDPNEIQVRDAMTGQMIFCYEDDDLETAARIMEEHQIRRLPVLNRDKQLVGILAQADIARTGKDELAGEMVEKISQPKGEVH